MKPQNPKKSIADMGVLDDIRGLLSTSQKKSAGRGGDGARKNSSNAMVTGLQAEIKKYKKQMEEQQQEIIRLENELVELTARLNDAIKVKDTEQKSEAVPDEVTQLAARIAELTATMEQIEGLLKLKSQDLLKKIARIFQEGGQNDAGLEFRRGVSQLEAAENFARFLRTLMG